MLRAEKFGDLATADHKVLSEGNESRNNHRYAVVVQDLVNSLVTILPCKTNFPGDPEEPNEVPGRRGNLKSFTLTIPWNLASLVKIFPGIIVRQRHTDQKQMVLLREQCVELRKGNLRYCCNHVWTKNGGWIPWSVIAFCETFKTSLGCWEGICERRFGMPFNGQVIPFGAMAEYHPISAKEV